MGAVGLWIPQSLNPGIQWEWGGGLLSRPGDGMAVRIRGEGGGHTFPSSQFERILYGSRKKRWFRQIRIGPKKMDKIANFFLGNRVSIFSNGGHSGLSGSVRASPGQKVVKPPPLPGPHYPPDHTPPPFCFMFDNDPSDPWADYVCFELCILLHQLAARRPRRRLCETWGG